MVKDVAEIEKEGSLEDYYLEVTSTNVTAATYKGKEEQKEKTIKDEIQKLKESKKQKRAQKKAQ